ncbi:MAG: hypothetical protein QOD98_2351 [Nocardioidaceae bacterium]|jgi:hypothetical protein|nr:hypothetical protein [Nocardioidaceae bacterium]
MSGPNDDLKAKMREALDKKNAGRRKKGEPGTDEDGPLTEKAHGSEVVGGGPKVHRRKAGGGGS